ncbi:reductase [Agaricicola taiwanensis]|uniref:Reductase n=1 Tax=Agaricicola taiwanensis TaxID=591372 RepID=A0A8J2YCE3_9RHOB|nr:NAD(P)H-dependent oxidoreductase [Agaricicola taiwanensis]GGE30414.1 reductase [Agaricicola taiwanensis]
MAFKLQTIIASTRPGRVGPHVAKWFNDFATQQGLFETELVDLASFNLPVYDEPVHPAKQDYKHEHTKAWSASVRRADAFVFVVPEYNFAPPSSLVNALTFLSREWNYAPAGIVSYGGASGGLRSAQVTKQFLTSLKMVAIPEGVMAPMVHGQIDSEAGFAANDLQIAGATEMLKELARWTEALQPLRAERK